MSVFANSRSVTHKGDKIVNTCAIPDVCKTPSPAGPVPIPYVNIAMDSDLDKGTKKVKVEGNPAANEGSNLRTSTGDEPGSAGGVVSSKFKGKMTWAMGSMDVKYEGKGVIRFMDVAQHNGNTFNTAFMQLGAVWVYGDDPATDETCPECGKPKIEHSVPETPDAEALSAKLIEKLDELGAQPGKRATRKGGRGYMIGVLISRCGSGKYAAMSGIPSDEAEGRNPIKTFKEACDAIGATYCPVPAIEDFRNVNGKITKTSFPPRQVAGRRRPANQCAAPKLVQKALADGHVVGAMSEKFYSPKKSVSVKIRVYSIRMGKEVKVNAAGQQFGHGDTVPSCGACQSNITPMLCAGTPSCGDCANPPE